MTPALLTRSWGGRFQEHKTQRGVGRHNLAAQGLPVDKQVT